jgi:hypothetical protein
MAINYNANFQTALQRNAALSMTNLTGLTINNQIIGGLHAYNSLDNITYGNADNKIPPIYTAGSSSTVFSDEAGCNPSGQCLASGDAVDEGFAAEEGEDITEYMNDDEGYGDICGDGDAEDFCAYQAGTTVQLPSSLLLNSDLVSSGRLQIGMIVYIAEKSQAYQFMIDNYTELYNAAETASAFSGTTFNTSASDSSAKGLAFINAWTVHKIEGEDNGSGGTWTRDEANWKKYPNEEEYFAINNVPASEKIDDFNFGDAIIIVPDSWDNKKVLSVSASIFTHSGTNLSSTISLNHIPTLGSASALDWTHSGNTKNSSSTFSSPLALKSGSILHLSQSPKFGGENFGYTATFKVKG